MSGLAESAEEPTHAYVVERYTAGLDVDDFQHVALRGKRGASLVSQDGRSVRHLFSILIARDEMFFSVYRAPDEAAVIQANERAGLPFYRITEVVLISSAAESTRDVPPARDPADQAEPAP